MFPIEHGDIPARYVRLPEGTIFEYLPDNILRCFHFSCPWSDQGSNFNSSWASNRWCSSKCQISVLDGILWNTPKSGMFLWKPGRRQVRGQNYHKVSLTYHDIWPVPVGLDMFIYGVFQESTYFGLLREIDSTVILLLFFFPDKSKALLFAACLVLSHFAIISGVNSSTEISQLMASLAGPLSAVLRQYPQQQMSQMHQQQLQQQLCLGCYIRSVSSFENCFFFFYFHPGRLTWNIIIEVWFRSFSY